MALTSSPLFARLSRFRTDEAVTRELAPYLAFQLYQRVWEAGRLITPGQIGGVDDVVGRLPADQTLRTDAETALGAVLEALLGLDGGPAHSAAVRAVYTGWIEFARAAGDAGEPEVLTQVLSAIGADAEWTGDWALAARARHYEGAARSRAADWDGARLLYRRSRVLARAAGSRVFYYRSRIGEANILWLRGDLPSAERMLERITKVAARVVPEVAPRAMLMRAVVRYQRGDLADAIRWVDAAYHASDDPALQARILSELANYLSEADDPDVREVGWRTLEYVAANSRERTTRHHAGISLLEMALRDGRAVDFARWKATLQAASLIPRLAVLRALAFAGGCRAFAAGEGADEWFAEALQLAERYQLGQLVLRVDAEWHAVVPAPGAPAPGRQEPLSSSAASRAGATIAETASRLDALVATGPEL